MKLHPASISIQDYTYSLPEEKIAKYPLEKRDDSRLLIYNGGTITESHYRDLAVALPADSLLVFNNTKVVEARLLFQKSTGSIIELFCLEPAEIYPDITTAMLQHTSVLWKCLVGGAKKWKDEAISQSVLLGDTELTLTARKKEKRSDHFIIEFSWDNEQFSFADVLHAFGKIPLPPYLNRAAEEKDKERYQTVYAIHDGSVAAPTAGLHFTSQLFQELHAKGIKDAYVTLHVGAGTFKPVKAETMALHEMHAELMDISIELIRQLCESHPKKIIAVGTTSLRVIESLYWFGVKVMLNPNLKPDQLYLEQWEAYDLDCHQTDLSSSLNQLIEWMSKNRLTRLLAKTQIIIAPGYKLKVANALITNFHQPQSTLLLLVAAIIGDDWRTIYNYALNNDFRFLSYGDGCLLWNKKL